MLSTLKEVEHEKREKKKMVDCLSLKSSQGSHIWPRFSKTRLLLLCGNIARHRTITGWTLVVSRAEMRKGGCISLICAYEGDF